MIYYILDKNRLHDYYLMNKDHNKNLLNDLTWSNKFILKYDDSNSLVPGSSIPEVVFRSVVDKNITMVGRLDMLTTTHEGVLGNEVLFTDKDSRDDTERYIALDERSLVNVVMSIVAYLMEFDGISEDNDEE